MESEFIHAQVWGVGMKGLIVIAIDFVSTTVLFLVGFNVLGGS